MGISLGIYWEFLYDGFLMNNGNILMGIYIYIWEI